VGPKSQVTAFFRQLYVALRTLIDRVRLSFASGPVERKVPGGRMERRFDKILLQGFHLMFISLIKRILFLPVVTVCLFGPLALNVAAQEGQLDPTPPKGTTPEAIIERFAAKETEFREARDQYTYKQTVKVQTVDGDTVTGEYQEVFNVVLLRSPHWKRSLSRRKTSAISGTGCPSC